MISSSLIMFQFHNQKYQFALPIAIDLKKLSPCHRYDDFIPFPRTHFHWHPIRQEVDNNNEAVR
jgi:hypothetical protein